MHHTIYNTLGRSVKNFRAEFGWSQEELGGRANLHPSYIGQIERGTKKISLLTLHKLAKALEVKPTDLLQDKIAKCGPSCWETKILAIIKGRPAAQQKFTYMLVKQALRAYQPG